MSNRPFMVIDDGWQSEPRTGGIQRRSTRRATTSEKESGPFNLLTDAQVRKILAYIKSSGAHKEEWHDAALLASQTALRYKDVALLRFDSVKYDSREAYLELAPEKTKTKTLGRVVYIRLVQEISDLLESL